MINDSWLEQPPKKSDSDRMYLFFFGESWLNHLQRASFRKINVKYHQGKLTDIPCKGSTGACCEKQQAHINSIRFDLPRCILSIYIYNIYVVLVHWWPGHI